ncbi:MAG TPA: SAM-dependent methyltransferase [Vicinamibacterales bacterium]|nr:SAM-dependent methyltransferase [Vicinamibacterales bacterium]
MRIADLVRERGPMTVAAFMDLALYDPEHGYYARAARRSGRAGDFFTSVDVGPIFGDLLEIQIAEMLELLQPSALGPQPSAILDLVEAGAGNGRLAADILRAMRERHRALYGATRLHLVEASAEARAAQRATLGEAGDRLASSDAALPSSFEGVLLANELLDAMPVHQVVMRDDGLREVYVVAGHQPESPAAGLVTADGPLSTPRLAEYLDGIGVTLQPGWRVEINLQAADWIRDAARRLRRGFIILIDYGHDARELYSASHSTGTLTTFSSHVSAGAESEAPPWLQDAGRRDITAHVDFTSVRRAAEADGLQTLGFLDQTYFLMGLLPQLENPDSAIRNPQLKTLLLPGGLGSTHKVLILAKGVGTPPLLGCAYRMRVT